MNYRHAYHAGNFADVLKHSALVALIEALQAKPKPLCYIETHAGAGRYVLSDEAARKTDEARTGIGRLRAMTDVIPLLQRYLQLADREGANIYPGSPLLAARMLRENDSAQLCELQPDEAEKLGALFRDDPRMHVHRRDGYAALKALLPPRERRGLVLIDPPFEDQAGEFDHIRAALETALKRWPTGIYAVWYPIKLERELQPFTRWLAACAARTVLDARLLLHPAHTAQRLNGAGLAILNPPWKLDTRLNTLLPTLARQLSAQTPAAYALQWLKSESAARS